MRLPHLIVTFLLLCHPSTNAYKIAIIGGGISGTFSAKYLAEYDVNHRTTGDNNRDCLLSEIDVYDVSPPPLAANAHAEKVAEDGVVQSSSADPRPTQYQGSRVSSITLQDGSVVELGASIIYEGNKLVIDMMNGDPERLVKGKPMGTSSTEEKEDDPTSKNRPSGFGIYHGNGQWLINTSHYGRYPKFIQKIFTSLHLLWRYNLDLFRLKNAVRTAINSFDIIYNVLNDTMYDVTYFESPMDIWETMGLRRLADVSFHAFCDGLGLYRDATLELKEEDEEESSSTVSSSWWNPYYWDWRKYIPGMGCIRSELVTAMTLNTYNQDLNEMNGIVGLVAYVPVGGELFSIKGGNYQLMQSALHQGNKIYDSSSCHTQQTEQKQQRIQRYQNTITTVVASENSMELYSDESESLGKYDVVILAAPIQQSRIQFLVESPMGMDAATLHEMPLGGVKENIDTKDDSSLYKDSTTNEDGEHLFAKPLTSSAIVPYTSVVTTLVSNATLNATYFGLDNGALLINDSMVFDTRLLGEGNQHTTIPNNNKKSSIRCSTIKQTSNPMHHNLRG